MFYPWRNWWKSVLDISHRKANFCIENAKSGKQRKSHVQNINLKGCDFLKNAKFISILFKFAFLFWNWFSSKNIWLTIFSLIIFKIWQKSDLSRYECTYNVSGIRTIHCPGLWNFLSLEERKMTGNSGLQKIVYSGAQTNFLLLLGQHPYDGVFFLTKNTE